MASDSWGGTTAVNAQCSTAGGREDMGRGPGRVRDPPEVVGRAALRRVATGFKKKRQSLAAEAGEEKGSGTQNGEG